MKRGAYTSILPEILMNKRLHAIYVGSFIVITILSTALLAVYGFNYYSTPLNERFFNPLNATLKPSGFIGHGIGILGSLMMIAGVAIYMLRKRIRSLNHLGYLKNWLELHIFLCTLGPILVLFHTAFKFGGIVSVSFWSMTAVVLSGVVGRFIYVRIPRTIQGQMLEMSELNSLSEKYSRQLREEYKVPSDIAAEIEKFSASRREKGNNLTQTISEFIKDFFGMKNVLRSLKHNLKAAGVPKVQRKKILESARSKLIIARRIGFLRTMQRLFKYWHVVHLPFAITMFFIMFIHIAVTIIFGYRWIF